MSKWSKFLEWLLKLVDAFNDGVDHLHGLPPLESRYRLTRDTEEK